MAMLTNPKTHIRNIVGNALFMPARYTGNMLAIPLERIAIRDVSKRTKANISSINANDKKLLDFAKQDYESNREPVKGENKYDMGASIKDKQAIFKSDKIGLKQVAKGLESVRKFNMSALDFEDEIFLKRAYIRAFASAMKAKELTSNDLIGNTKHANDLLSEVQTYATTEARKATYRDASKLANALNRLERTNTGAKIFMGGIIPFKKTPINLLKRGVEYSPIGIVNGVSNMVKGVKDGSIDPATSIHQITNGLSGTSIFALGIYLASLGLIDGGDSDDRKLDNFERNQGAQRYSLKIGDKSYTLDWAAPLSMPFFSGVETYNAMRNKEDMEISSILDSLTKITEPVFNLSMLQGVSSAIKSASYSDNPVTAILTNTISSYASQFVPTIFGQVARTIDPIKRTSYIDKNKDVPKTTARDPTICSI